MAGGFTSSVSWSTLKNKILKHITESCYNIFIRMLLWCLFKWLDERTEDWTTPIYWQNFFPVKLNFQLKCSLRTWMKGAIVNIQFVSSTSLKHLNRTRVWQYNGARVWLIDWCTTTDSKINVIISSRSVSSSFPSLSPVLASSSIVIGSVGIC